MGRSLTKLSLGAAALGFGILLGGSPAAADDAAEAKTIFDSRCTTCHGAAGKGDGAAAAALNPKPRDLSSAEWQNSVTDEHIEKIIVSGGPAVGKSPLMPPNPDLAGKAAVVQELRKLVRGLGGK
jgi:mono/diheme cytochrome c family protein